MNRHICALLFGGVLVLLLLVSSAFGADGWWNESWQYRRAITINNENPHDLFDYQVEIVVPCFKGMNYNFSDIRFTYKFGDEEREIPYWIEELRPENATVWVKVPYIPKISNTTVYMYYGNPSATSKSDGDAVFEFFDDFETWTGWTQYGEGKVSQDDTRAYDGNYSSHKTTACDPNGAYKSLGKTLGRNIALHFRVNRNSGYTGNCHCDRIGILNADGDGYGWGYDHDNNEIFIDKRTDYNATDFHRTSATDEMDAWSKGILKITRNTIYAERYLSDGTPAGSTSLNDVDYTNFNRVYIFGGHDYWVDQIFIRKYSEPEPIANVWWIEQSKDFYVFLRTDKANYSTGDVVNLVIEVNRMQENPQVMKFKLELEDLDDKPDTLIETGSFLMPAKFHKKVVLRFAIPESPFVSSGRYAFKAYLIEPSLGEILAYDAVYFYVKEKEAKAKEQQSEAFAAFSLVEG